ncbi:hypothetical protein [Desulfosporosinus metallidurans]|uniref:hypothetical protein n=1 Tax=Desulfosporosinus metallidurans TaxID=1888891 RepID=UPI00147D7B71
MQVQLHILLTCKLKSRIPTSYTKTTYRYLQLKLDLKRLQLSIDLALASEAQHPIAGDLLFGHRHHMFDLGSLSAILSLIGWGVTFSNQVRTSMGGIRIFIDSPYSLLSSYLQTVHFPNMDSTKPLRGGFHSLDA